MSSVHWPSHAQPTEPCTRHSLSVVLMIVMTEDYELGVYYDSKYYNRCNICNNNEAYNIIQYEKNYYYVVKLKHV